MCAGHKSTNNFHLAKATTAAALTFAFFFSLSETHQIDKQACEAVTGTSSSAEEKLCTLFSELVVRVFVQPKDMSTYRYFCRLGKRNDAAQVVDKYGIDYITSSVEE